MLNIGYRLTITSGYSWNIVQAEANLTLWLINTSDRRYALERLDSLI
jgi:hypothetical protein